MERQKWVYEITLNNRIVGDQGDAEFETREEALADANNLIVNGLCEEYEVSADTFKVEVFKGNIMIL